LTFSVEYYFLGRRCSLMAEITAPIGGMVWKINVAVGDKVEADDEIITLEALKMETPVYAPEDGTVVSISVQEKDKVEENQVLAVIE